MINKKNLWFLTLFSLILVLSVYYITMPSELLVSNNSENIDTIETNVEESNVVEALKTEDNNKYNKYCNSIISFIRIDLWLLFNSYTRKY